MSEYWQSRACLVTGGTGFGGSHLAEQLVNRGAKVYVLDRMLPANSYLNLSGVRNAVDFLVGDIRDQGLVQSLLQRCDIETVFHLAAQPLIPVSNSLPYETLSTNAMGTYAMLEAVRTAERPIQLVFASSGAYYGTTRTNDPINEEHSPLVAANIYSPSKVAADVAVRCYAKTYGIQTVCCRFINTYGPGDINFSRIIPRAIRNLILSEPYDFGTRDDGTTCLDYMYIGDMSNAYVCAAQSLPSVAGEAFNFGTNRTISTRDLTRMISRAFDGRDREPQFRGSARDESIIKHLDVSKAKEILGWEADVALEQGLEETIHWYRKYWSRLWTHRPT